MKISLMAAMAKNRVIAYQDEMPWHLPADLKYFQDMTIGKPIVMGRKTFDCLGKPLPKRRNIVITRQKDLQIDGCEVFCSLEDALAVLKDEPEVMITGGEMIYRLALPMADCLYLTFIDLEAPGDTFFPEWNEDEWCVVFDEPHEPDEKNPYHYRFITYERIQS